MSEFEHSAVAVLNPQEKVLVITRRLYQGDARRHFVGMVQRYDGGAIRVRGYAFVYESSQGGFTKRKSQRTRIFPLDNHVIVFVLPDEVDIAAVHYEVGEHGLVATDNKYFTLELSEFLA